MTAVPDLTLCELDAPVALEVGLPPVPLPVRTEKVSEIFHGGKADLDALVREIDAVIGDDLELSLQLGAAVARLADAAGQVHANDGALLEATELFRIGLKHRPEYPGLNAKTALALQIQGFLSDASRHYDMALIRRDTPANPTVLILAARNRADLGDPAGALDLLDRCPGSMWDDPSFRALYLAYCAAVESLA